jgi:hypothetical protein
MPRVHWTSGPSARARTRAQFLGAVRVGIGPIASWGAIGLLGRGSVSVTAVVWILHIDGAAGAAASVWRPWASSGCPDTWGVAVLPPGAWQAWCRDGRNFGLSMEPLIGFISPTLMWYYELSWPGGRVGSETMGVLALLCGCRAATSVWRPWGCLSRHGACIR